MAIVREPRSMRRRLVVSLLACSGPDGLRHAQELQRLAAGVLHLPPERVRVASTGVIGRP